MTRKVFGRSLSLLDREGSSLRLGLRLKTQEAEKRREDRNVRFGVIFSAVVVSCRALMNMLDHREQSE